jgi:hypothetical protein
VSTDGANSVAPAGQKTRLRATEKLVSGEGNYVGSGCDRLCGHGLVAQAEARGVEKRSAPVIDDAEYPIPAREVSQPLDRRLLCESDYAEIARMHMQDSGCPRPDRLLVVL